MKILLTGANGMVGRAILSHESCKGHNLLAPSSVALDLKDSLSVESFVAAEQPDLVIHAAGRVGGIQANIAQPVDFMIDNMEIGLSVIKAARAARVPRVLNLGSSCMYPRNAPSPLVENSIGDGQLEPSNEGYALAKIATTRLCEYVTREDPKLSYKTLVPCNLYGYYDKFDPKLSHLVPAVIRKIHDAKISGAKTVEIWGDGTARREFMFSTDLADAVWATVDGFERIPSLMNVGLGRDYSINEYYKITARIVGWDGQFTHDLNRPTGMKQKLLDVTHQTDFGWTPKVLLEEGIQRTYDHFLEYLHRDAQ